MPFEIPKLPTAFSIDRTTRRQPRIEDPAHLAFIRKLPSIISGRTPCEACHVRYGDALRRKKTSAKGMKPDDAWTVPMTADEHRSQHDGSEAVWWRSQGIDPLAIACALYAVSGDLEEGRKIIANARRIAA